MIRRAFFVLGAEGSGTNMLAEAFVSAGCHYEPSHNSHLEDYEFEKMPDLLVFRRSLPHRGEWPRLDNIRAQMERAEYAVWTIFIIRDWYCAAASIMRRAPDRNINRVRYDVRRAVAFAFNNFGYDLTCISYEAFCLDPKYLRWLFIDRFGLKDPKFEVAYANEKYYKQGAQP